jgi:hypothetical protein
MTSKHHHKNARDKKIDFIYRYNNKFTLMIKNDYLFIIINNKKSPYVSKWELQNNNNMILLVSNDEYNKNLSQEHIKILTDSISDGKVSNQIKINNINYEYKTKSIIDLTNKILKTTYFIKNKSQLGGNYVESTFTESTNYESSYIIKKNILNTLSSIDKLLLPNIKDYIEDDYLKILE